MSILEFLATGAVGALVGVLFAAWRLKGNNTWGRSVVVVMGGPRPTVPK